MQIYTYLNFILKAASFAWVKFVWKKVPIKTHRHISNVLYCDTYCFTKLPYSPLVSFLMKANMLLMSKIKFQLSFLWESTSALDVHKFKELLSISIEIIEMIHTEFKLIWVHSYSPGYMLSVRSPVWRCWMTQRCRTKREHRPGRHTGCRRAELAVKEGRRSITDGFFIHLMSLSSMPSLTGTFTVAKHYPCR